MCPIKTSPLNMHTHIFIICIDQAQNGCIKTTDKLISKHLIGKRLPTLTMSDICPLLIARNVNDRLQELHIPLEYQSQGKRKKCL